MSALLVDISLNMNHQVNSRKFSFLIVFIHLFIYLLNYLILFAVYFFRIYCAIQRFLRGRRKLLQKKKNHKTSCFKCDIVGVTSL